MSYILKALNQADADRRRGQTPDVLSPPAAPPREKSRSNLLAILAVALALNTAVLAFIYWPQSREQWDSGDGAAVLSPTPAHLARTPSTDAGDEPRKGNTPHSSASRLLAETRLAAKPRRAPPEAVEKPAVAQATKANEELPVTGSTAGKTPVAEYPRPVRVPVPTVSGGDLTPRPPAGTAIATKRPDTRLRPTAAGVSAPPQGTDTGKVEAPTPTAVVSRTITEQPRIPLLHELTHEVQAQLPPLQVNVISYSEEPARRFAIINMKKYREGDTLADSAVSVHRITRDAAILDYGAGLARLPGGIR